MSRYKAQLRQALNTVELVDTQKDKVIALFFLDKEKPYAPMQYAERCAKSLNQEWEEYLGKNKSEER